MNFFRIIFMTCGAALLGVLQVGVVSALPFPYSEFPLLAILLACAFVVRSRATVFWYGALVAGISDLYSGVGFGASIVSLIVLTLVGHRVSSEMITHRSVFGSAVIGALTGFVWSVTRLAAITFFEWWKSIDATIGVSHIIMTVALQTTLTALVCVALFMLLPRWWLARAPTTVNSRGL